jgi:hypothetical protein
MRKTVKVIILLGMIGTLIACTSAASIPGKSTTASNTPTSAPTGQGSAMTIGVEYGILGVAREYSKTGVKYTKLQDAFAIWGNIEPEQGEYAWGPLDALVLEYQQAGFTGIQMDLTALSPWASTIPAVLGIAPKDVNTFPKPEFLDDYAAYVSAVVERYDKDGVDDMPGLLFPIHDYGIEREYSGYWPGTADEYVQLLRIAYPAIKQADPQARVLLVAILMADVFDGSPNKAEINRRLSVDVDYMRKSVPEIRTILAACDAYDIVDFHSLGNYTEIPLTAQWIRAELQSDGCGEKPLWIGDAFPMSGLVGYGGFVPPTPFAPVTVETRDAVVALLKSVADPADPDHAASQSWLYAETAIGLTRKIIVSAGSGVQGINIGNLEDWKSGNAGFDQTMAPMLGASMFMGLTDTTVTNQKPGGDLPYNGQEWSKARKPSHPRPAYYALQLVNEKTGGYTSVEKLDLGENIWAYRFEKSSGPVWVLWYDDGALYLPGQTLPMVEVNLPIGAENAIVIKTPAETGNPDAPQQNVTAVNGIVTLQLDATPVFVELVQ